MVFLISCSSDSNQNENETKSNVSNANRSSNTNISPEVMEKLNISTFYNLDNNDVESLNFIKEIEEKNITTSDLDLDEINIITFTNSNVKIISVPVKNSNQKILAYNFKNDYVLLKSFNDGENISIKTLDGNKIYESKIENNNLYISEVFDNSLVDDFSNDVYLKALNETGIDESSDTCCRKMSYRYCVRCTVNELFGGIIYLSVVTYFAPEVTVAVFASCIGSGPKSFC